jgi:hypothetical protein
MGADEEGTHECLKAHLGELVNPKIAAIGPAREDCQGGEGCEWLKKVSALTPRLPTEGALDAGLT